MKQDASHPNSQLPSLSALQSSLQAAILDGDDAILGLIPDNARTSRETLFAVYRNAYRARLAEVLANDYPCTRGLAGDDLFEMITQAYIAAAPSRTQNARWFGGGLPAFLATFAATAEQPAFTELAWIEKSISDAFDSHDAHVLSVAALLDVAPEDWSRLMFNPHPSASALLMTTNAFEIWKALKDELTPPAAERSSTPNTIVVWRQDVRPRVREVPYEEAMMWTEACRGATFGILCQLLATFDEPNSAAARAAGYLQGWLTTDMLTSAQLSKVAQVD